MGLIYKIECLETGLVYIGQTTQTLKKRFGQHKSDFKADRCKSVYEVLKNGFAFPYVIEIVDDESKLSEREYYHIQNTECVNEYNGSCDYKQYRKEYYENNKQEILEKQKKYTENNRENILVRKKKYYEANKETISEKWKQNYQNNKEKILEKMKETYTCSCGSILRKCNKARHERESQTHKAYLENLNK